MFLIADASAIGVADVIFAISLRLSDHLRRLMLDRKSGMLTN